MPIAPENYLPRLTLMENLLYGRISAMAGLQADLVQDEVSRILEAHDLKKVISVNLFDVQTAIGGTNLPVLFQQRAAFGRAAIKRPDVLVLNQAFAPDNPEQQALMRKRLSTLLPDTTQIYINDSFPDADAFDVHVEIKHGRIDGQPRAFDAQEGGGAASDDLRRKLRIIGRNPLFASLNPRNRRLLAFAAQWYTAEKGQRIFAVGERPDAVYLCLSGRAELGLEDEGGVFRHVSDVEPGRLIGDLAIILDEPRQLDLNAVEQTQFLRIGAEQFRSVIENDPVVLLNLLRTVSGYLSDAAELMIAAGLEVPREMGPHQPPRSPEEAEEE